jgi:hypothetical protein
VFSISSARFYAGVLIFLGFPAIGELNRLELMYEQCRLLPGAVYLRVVYLMNRLTPTSYRFVATRSRNQRGTMKNTERRGILQCD